LKFFVAVIICDYDCVFWLRGFLLFFKLWHFSWNFTLCSSDSFLVFSAFLVKYFLDLRIRQFLFFESDNHLLCYHFVSWHHKSSKYILKRKRFDAIFILFLFQSREYLSTISFQFFRKPTYNLQYTTDSYWLHISQMQLLWCEGN